MADQRWEEQLRGFLRKTGEDLRRTSDDIREEAQRLLEGVMDRERQTRVRENLRELSVWAKRAAEDVARKVEGAATHAEQALQSAAKKVTELRSSEEEAASGAAKARPGGGRPAKKTVGKRAAGTAKKGGASRGKKKTVGRKPPEPTS